MEKTHKNGNMLFDKYYPQHPLPKEIKDLPETETVCEFCGISYLIHSEIKRLEEEIILLNKKIKNLEELEINEKKYEAKCQNLMNELDQYNSKYSTLEESFNQLKTERDSLNANLVEKEDLIIKLQSSVKIWKIDKEKLIEKQKQIYQYLFELKKNNRDLKDRLMADKNEIELNMSNDRMKNQITIASIVSLIEKIKLINQSEVDLYETKLRTQNSEIQHLEDEIKKKTTELSEELEKVSAVVNKNKILLEENNKLEFKINEQLLVIVQKDEIIKLANEANNEIRSSKITDTNSLKIEMNALKKENKNLEDLLEKEKKLNILIKSEFESTVRHLNDISNVNEDFTRKIASYEAENKILKKKLEEINENNESKLKDSDRQISVLKDQITELLLEVKSIQQSSQECKIIFEASFNDKSLLYEKEVENLKNVNKELQVMKEKLKLKELENLTFEKSINQYQNENQELQKVLNEYEKQKNQRHFEKEESENKIIQELENEILEKEKIIDRMEEDLIKNNNEIYSLKQMVQQECEERYELTESLNRAREQLLIIGEFNVSKNPINLPPIPQRNSSSSTISVKTNSSQNSQKTSLHDRQNNSIIQRKNSKNSIISTKRKLERLFNE